MSKLQLTLEDKTTAVCWFTVIVIWKLDWVELQSQTVSIMFPNARAGLLYLISKTKLAEGQLT